MIEDSRVLQDSKTLQKCLNNFLQTDLLIDGVFGAKSQAAFLRYCEFMSLNSSDQKAFEFLRTYEHEGQFIKSDKSTTLSKNQYYTQEFEKTFVTIHHTVSNSNGKGVITYWNGNADHVGTPFVIGGDGTLYECFSWKYWCHHLGIKDVPNVRSNNAYVKNIELNRSSIAIEICSFGKLDKKGAKFYHTYGGEVPADEVITLEKPFRGSKYFHRYTQASLDKLKETLTTLKAMHPNWKSTGKEITADWFEFSEKAFFEPDWITTHVNFRKDKSDCYPDPRLIQILNDVNV